MATVLERWDSTSTDGESPATTQERRRSATFVLWFSVPMAVLAIAGSLGGIFIDSIYSKETENWASQAVAQDIVNLAAFTGLLILAVFAVRGSLRAYLAWLGVVGYSAYTFALYTFAVHFGPLFLVYVAVFGLSIFALIMGLVRLDFERVKETFTARVPRRFASVLLLTIGGFFYLLWLSAVVSSSVSGEVPEDVVKAGLLTNPVHVIDMAVFLPAMLLAGASLLQKRPIGYVLTPLVLGAAFTISLGIVVMQPVLEVRGESPAWGIGVVIAIVAAVELVALIRLLQAVRSGARVSSVVRASDWTDNV